ncbi:MAG: sialidase family protein [Bacteroidaceae bacterium]
MSSLKINISILTFLMITSLVTIQAAKASDNQIIDVYQQGEARIAAYRIPALIQTKKGTLLAFAEARKGGLSDTGDISIVVKRSKDNGRTWTDLTTVWSDAGNTCGNPVPIVDRKTGRIFLIGTWNNGADHENDLIRRTAIDTRRIFLLHSDDDGQTWSSVRYPQNLLESVCQGSMLNYMSKGKITNTLFFSNPASTDERKNSTLKLSRDEGKTWSQTILVHKGFGAYSDLVNLGHGDIGIIFEYGASHPYEKIGFASIRIQKLSN